jgi:hypothetical protein
MDFYKERAHIVSRLPKIKFGEKPTEEQKEIAIAVNKECKELLQRYIQETKPCDIGDLVSMTLKHGRKVEGIVLSLNILHDGKIHPTSYKIKNKVMYISQPLRSLTVISKKDETC